MFLWNMSCKKYRAPLTRWANYFHSCSKIPGLAFNSCRIFKVVWSSLLCSPLLRTILLSRNWFWTWWCIPLSILRWYNSITQLLFSGHFFWDSLLFFFTIYSIASTSTSNFNEYILYAFDLIFIRVRIIVLSHSQIRL